MPRKLFHAYRGLAIALGLLTVGLIVSLPAQEPIPSDAALQAPGEREPGPSRSHRRALARESLALPFFSFAQSLRRGNGS